MAIVPVKPFAEAKRRLAEVMDSQARAELSAQFLRHTLDVLSGINGISRVAVVSRDVQVLEYARKRRAWAMWESGSGLNEALEQATRVAVANGARALLIVPTDLPLLKAEDVEEMIELGKSAPCLVIAAARRDEGTNALLVNPAGLIPYAFGKSSFDEHRRRAEEAGAAVLAYRSDTTAFDIDVPEDLAEWRRSTAAQDELMRR